MDFNRSIPVALGLVILIGALNFGWTSLHLVTYPYDLDYSEGFVIEDVQRFVETGELYSEPRLDNGFEAVKYPPVFYILFAGLGGVTGYTFLVGRLLSILPLLGITGILYLLLWREDDLPGSAHVLALLLLIPYLSIYTGMTARVDMLALLFAVTGVYLFTQGRERASLVPLLFAVFTKQTFVAGFAACLIALLARHDWRTDGKNILHRRADIGRVVAEYRDVWRFGGLYLGGVVAGVLVLQWWSHGNFLLNVVSANVGAWQLRIGLLNWIHLTFLPLFGLAAYYIYLYRDRVWGSYFLISLVIGLLQLVRGGAWAHPVMEPFVVATVCVMLLYLRASAVRRPVSLVLILQVLVFFSAPLVSGSVFDVAAMPQKNIEADRTLTAAIEDAGGATLSEHIGYQLATGQDTSPEVWGMYEQYDSGRVSAAAVQQFFQQQNYSRIITYKRLYTLPIAPYINRHYTVTAQVDRTDLLLHTEQWRVYEWTG